MKKTKITAITGPSSSGKTKLAIELAKRINGEIISADSRQIYKELNIGSAKPSIEEREGIPHHLIDIADLTQDYTVANFCDDAKKAVDEITKKGKAVIIAGGTGLYFRTFLQDFDLPRVEPNKELRAELEQKSSKELHDMLSKLDFDIAQKIHFNNKVKIIRALEVCITLGIPMSKAQKKKENMPDVIWCGLYFENRQNLYDRVNQRVDKMFEAGLFDEADTLFKKYPDNHILSGTIGYREFIPYYSGEISLSEVKEKIKQNTRRYTKRQISWFSNFNKDITPFDVEKMSFIEMADILAEKYND